MPDQRRIDGAQRKLGERDLRPHRHGQRDHPVERDHRTGRHHREQVVEGEDLPPVRVCCAGSLRVHGRDGRLQLVGPDRPLPQCGLDQRDALVDHRAVPQRPVLLVEGHQCAGGVDTGGPARGGQQHQGKECTHLVQYGDKRRLRPHPRQQHPGQPDGFDGEVTALQLRTGARRVALGEDQVEHGCDGLHPCHQVVPGGELEGGPCLPDAALGPADPLGDRGFRHEERSGDLRCRQAPDRSQRERDLGRGTERRVAAQQQELQGVVSDLLLVHPCLGDGEGPLVASPARGLAPPVVDQPALGDRDQPGPWLAWSAAACPGRRGLDQGLLDGVLRVGEVAAVASQEDAEDLRRKAAQQVLQLRFGQAQAIAAVSMTARTSTSPAPACTSGIWAAISSARSSDVTSTR